MDGLPTRSDSEEQDESHRSTIETSPGGNSEEFEWYCAEGDLPLSWRNRRLPRDRNDGHEEIPDPEGWCFD